MKKYIIVILLTFTLFSCAMFRQKPLTGNYSVITGRITTRLHENDLLKKLELQDVNTILDWLEGESTDIVNSSNIPAERVFNILTTNFNLSKRKARKELQLERRHFCKYNTWDYQKDWVSEWVIIINSEIGTQTPDIDAIFQELGE